MDETMEAPKTIPDWHERILAEALKWRESHPDFSFSLRTGDIKGTSRLSQGYWFPGSNYLFFSPFKLNDQNNKTKTIGFVIRFSRSEQPIRSYIEVVFGSVQDPALQAVHQSILDELGGFVKKGKVDKYQRRYESEDPLEAFDRFLREDYPRIRRIIEESGQTDAFVVTEADFAAMLDRIERHRQAQDRPEGPNVAEEAPEAGDDPINLILYGPPGTGKTHWLRQKIKDYTDSATRLDRDAWLQQTVADYGWRPVIGAALAELGGAARVPAIREHRWVVAKARQRGRDPAKLAQTIWSYLQEHTPEEVETVKNAIRRPPYMFTKSPEGVWSLLEDWDEQDPESSELREILQKGPADRRTEVRRYRMVTFHPSFTYEDFIRGIRPVMDEDATTAQFRLVDGVFKEICDEARGHPGQRYALFIDEINRANIAKVFGELITLIEPDKRARYDENGKMIRGVAVRLPGGSGAEAAEEPFAVPANLDIYGTMNTADRSIALLDIALRRRFEFREMPPRYDLLDENVGEVHLGRLLERINDRLEYVLDRDHRIGHSYLMSAESIDDLRAVFQLQIIPLLQEYFFDDFGRVALVLATSPSAPQFVDVMRVPRQRLFSASVPGLAEERDQYVITAPEAWTEASFLGIYSNGAEPAAAAGSP